MKGLRFPAAVKARVRKAWEAGTPYPVIEFEHGVPEKTVYKWAKSGRWETARRRGGKGVAQRIKEARTRDKEREQGIYGHFAGAVRFLRSRGWVVVRTAAGLFDVGHRQLGPDEFMKLVAREQRLAGH